MKSQFKQAKDIDTTQLEFEGYKERCKKFQTSCKECTFNDDYDPDNDCEEYQRLWHKEFEKQYREHQDIEEARNN